MVMVLMLMIKNLHEIAEMFDISSLGVYQVNIFWGFMFFSGGEYFSGVNIFQW